MWAVNPNSWTISRTSSKSYPLSRHIPCGLPGAGWGRSTGMLSKVSRASFMSLRLAPPTASPTGMPSASTSRLRLAPSLPRSVGFLPVFFPPQRGLGRAPVHAQPRPVDPPPVVVGQEAVLPQRQEDALLDPQLEAVVGGGAGAEAGGGQRLPLAAGAQHEQDRLHAGAFVGARLGAAEGVGVGVLGDEQGDGVPQVVGDAPLVLHTRAGHAGPP